MTITSAKFCNAEETAVIVDAVERGAVAVYLTGEDVTQARADYLAWAEDNETDPFS